MKITLTSIAATNRTSANRPSTALTADYLARLARYSPTAAPEDRRFASEEALFVWLDRLAGRTAPHLILLDSRGKPLSSEAFAAYLGRLRDAGTQHLVCAIGPAGGWSGAARDRADLLLSFGPITLPHELARVVLAEQLYRAASILAGHPYHLGH